MAAPAAEAIVGICVEKLADFIEEKLVTFLGVKDELKKLQRRLKRIEWVLKDAGRRSIRGSAIDPWLDELENVVHEANDAIDFCRREGSSLLLDEEPSSSSDQQVLHLPSLSFFSSIQLRRKVAGRIRSLNDKIEEIANDAWILNLAHVRPEVQMMTMTNARPTAQFVELADVAGRRRTSQIVEADVVGREIEYATKRLVEELAVCDDGRQSFRVLAVTGMGGIGKTTLAQKIYNHPRIKDKFEIQIWLCVSQKYSDIQLLREFIRKAGGTYGPDESVGELIAVLTNTVGGKSFFLVLDDVWRSDIWIDLLRNPLQNGAASGCTLVTTRDQNVGRRVGAKFIHKVEKLSVDSGWELLCKRAYLDREEEIQSLRNVGVEIVNKCDGLPLAINVIAGLLATKERSRIEWEKVLKSDVWCMSELPEEFRGALYMSYDDLAPHLKQCFLSLSLYPKGEMYSRRVLCRLWVAEGFVNPKGDLIMEELAEDYYCELIRRSLLQPDSMYFDERRCKIHDLLWSLAQFLSQNENFYGDPQYLDADTISKLRRLSISEGGEIVAIPSAGTDERLHLRTLLLIRSPPTIEHNLFARLVYLQILVLNGEGIESIPDSIGDLKQLRMLDLDRTRISQLPESIGSLTNLQFLNLKNCKSLNTLPKGITRLCNLRRLSNSGTPLKHVPKGIGRLHLLNNLTGFVTTGDSSYGDEKHGWDLEELDSLSQLRWLMVSILEIENSTSPLQSTNNVADKVPAVASPPRGASILKNKCFLKTLVLSCTPQEERVSQLPYTEDEIDKIEEIFERLCPPSCLEELWIKDFYGRRCMSWMSSSSLGTYFPYLTYLLFVGLPLCSKLPPLGQLPHLKYLQIRRASAVISVGPKFLNSGGSDGLQIATAFPKLESLIMAEMPNWEEWSLVDHEREQSPLGSLRIMPHLETLCIVDCPKLKALPEGLRQLKSFQHLKVNTAHNVSAIENLSFITELEILENNGMERVSNLPALRKLTICDTPALKFVDNLAALQYLELQDYSMESLPEWLLRQVRQQAFGKKRKRMVHQREHLRDNDLKLTMRCSAAVIQRCRKGGPDWPIIECFSRVSAYTEDRSAYLEYTKQNGHYRTNQ